MPSASFHVLTAFLVLSIYAYAKANPPVPTFKPLSIQKLADPVRSRILLGTSTEGTEVDANMQSGQYTRIVSQGLYEFGYIISDFRFDHSVLTRAQVVRVGYKGFPESSLTTAPPHQHLVIDPTDVVISNHTHDFTPSAPPCADADCVTGRKDARAEADMYVRLMNTPPPAGKAEDESDWDCVSRASQDCASFKPD